MSKQAAKLQNDFQTAKQAPGEPRVESRVESRGGKNRRFNNEVQKSSF